MTNDKIALLFINSFSFPDGFKIENSGTEDVIFRLEPYSCALIDGRWTLEKEWSYFSNDSGWDGGSDPVEEDPGYSHLASALSAMARLHLYEKLKSFEEKVDDIEQIEREAIRHVMET